MKFVLPMFIAIISIIIGLLLQIFDFFVIAHVWVAVFYILKVLDEG